jgi:hypothetical protein
MDIDHKNGVVRSFTDLAPGTAFRFGLRRVIYIAVKTIETDGTEGCAVLAPGHPDLGAKPGTFDVAPLTQYPILAMPDLRVVLTNDLKQWTMGQGASLEVGTMLLTPSRTMLCVGSGKGEVVKVDIGTGEIVRDRLAEVPIVVRRWSLIDPDDAAPQTLFEFTG